MPTGGHSRENGSARQAQGQVTSGTSGHMPLAAPQLSTLGPTTWGDPSWGSWACRAHRRLLESPGIPPHLQLSSLCLANLFPQTTRIFHDWLQLPSLPSPTTENLRAQTQPCPQRSFCHGTIPHSC